MQFITSRVLGNRGRIQPSTAVAAHAEMWLSSLISFLSSSVCHRAAEFLEDGAKKIYSDADSQRESVRVCVSVSVGQGLMW